MALTASLLSNLFGFLTGVRIDSLGSGGKISSSVAIGRPNRSNFGAVSIGIGVGGFNSSTIDFFFLTFFGGADFGAPKPPPAKHEEVKVTLAVAFGFAVKSSSVARTGELMANVMVEVMMC